MGIPSWSASWQGRQNWTLLQPQVNTALPHRQQKQREHLKNTWKRLMVREPCLQMPLTRYPQWDSVNLCKALRFPSENWCLGIMRNKNRWEQRAGTLHWPGKFKLVKFSFSDFHNLYHWRWPGVLAISFIINTSRQGSVDPFTPSTSYHLLNIKYSRRLHFIDLPS